MLKSTFENERRKRHQYKKYFLGDIFTFLGFTVGFAFLAPKIVAVFGNWQYYNKKAKIEQMIRVIAGGKKPQDWEALAVAEYEKRLRRPYDLTWQFVDEAELGAKLEKLGPEYYVILLDERGEILDSPAFARRLEREFAASKKIALVLGGAFGHFDEKVRARTDLVWSLSKLVFPHRLCRVIVAEQVYRAMQINAGRSYHHA